MRLIDADVLIEKEYSRLREGEVLHRIPPSHVDAAPIIDPVHAAGGCYCRECFHSELEEHEDNEGWVTQMDEYWCNKHKDTMSLNGFCSEGRKDDIK